MTNRRMIFAGLGLILLIAATIGMAQELADPTPGSSGTSYGTVREITKEYIRVESPGDIGRRYYFSWVEKPGATTKPAPQVQVGQTVAVKWSFDDRRRMETISPSTLPAVAKPQVSSVDASKKSDDSIASTTAPTEAGSNSGVKSTSDTVNALIDGLLATGDRLVALPMAMLLPALAIVVAGVGLLVRRMIKPMQRWSVATLLIRLEAVALIFAFIILIDRKFTLLEDAITSIRTGNTASAVAALQANGQARKNVLFDASIAQSSLERQFGQVSIKPVVYDQATDVVQVQIERPLIRAFLTVIDLKNPAVEVQVGGDLNQKTLTSAFAKQNRSSIAINGEAGLSPNLYSGLGGWSGNMMVKGSTILKESSTIPRPSLIFDSKNLAMYLPALSNARELPKNAFNVIWGRSDSLQNGSNLGDSRDRQPRTAMGINQDGTKLYLMVVDGRQPRYSNGFTRFEVGEFLKSFGAFNAMLCDEGGSSCMYAKDLGGIINIPSDNQGQERPTYTHFGIAMR